MSGTEPETIHPVPTEPPTRPNYKPRSKKALQKTGEFFQTIGTGGSGLSALQIALLDAGATDGLQQAGLILLGLGFVVAGIYLQAEAER